MSRFGPNKTPAKPPQTSIAPAPHPLQFSGNNNNASEGGSGGKHPAPGGNSGGRRQRAARRTQRVSAAANTLVAGEIREGVQSLRQDRRIARRQAKRDRSQANADYRRSLGDLNYIYGETGDYVNNMNNQINQAYTDQSSRTAAAQQAFVSQLQANSQNAGQGLSTELSRLGLQGVDNSQFASDAQNALNVAGQTGINDQSNIALQQQGANSIGSLLGGMVQGSHLSQVGQAANAKADTMFQIFQNKHDAYDKVAEAISDLKGSRGDLTVQMMQQLASSNWGRYLTGGKGRGKRRRSSSGSSSYSGSSGYSQSSGGTRGSGNTSGSGGGNNDPLLNLLYGALNGGPR